MLKNLANEINNLLLDNEGKTQEILNLNSNIDSLNIAIEVLQNENQSLLDVKAELTNRILELEEQIVNVEANKELENIIVELNDQILSLNAEREKLSQTVIGLEAKLNETESLCNNTLELNKALKEEKTELEEDIVDLQVQLETLEAQANIKLDEVKNIVEELKELVANA